MQCLCLLQNNDLTHCHPQESLALSSEVTNRSDGGVRGEVGGDDNCYEPIHTIEPVLDASRDHSPTIYLEKVQMCSNT